MGNNVRAAQFLPKPLFQSAATERESTVSTVLPVNLLLVAPIAA